MKMIKTYSELIRIPSFEERFEYLRLNAKVCQETFGNFRYLNQKFYRNTPEWKSIRRKVIIRDNGCDLAFQGREIYDRVYIHHITPITIDDILNETELLYDLENLICVSFDTHQAIHYGNSELLVLDPIVRQPNDTSPWRR